MQKRYVKSCLPCEIPTDHFTGVNLVKTNKECRHVQIRIRPPLALDPGR
jgi:hypothetical protein